MITNKQLEELKLNATQIAALRVLIDEHTSTKSAPNIYNGDMLVAKWCTKHKQYELIDTFPKNARSSDGYYSHCRYAEKYSKGIAARISKLQTLYFDADIDAQADIKSEVESLKEARSDYDFKRDVPSGVYTEQVTFEQSKLYKEFNH